MSFSQEIETCLAAAVGAAGLSEAELAEDLARSLPSLARLRAAREAGSLPHLTIAARRDDLPAIEAAADRLRAACDTVVLLGTGGSSLGARTLQALAEPGTTPRLRVLENVDPVTVERLLAGLDLARTGLVVVSKSGSTPETLSQFLILLAAMEAALGRAALAERIVAVTEPKDSPLTRLARDYGLTCLDHDPELGGRYSVLSVVGALPARLLGLDVERLRAGAQAVLDATLDAPEPAQAPPALGAAVAVGLAERRGLPMSVLLAYCDRLDPFVLWYRQLWAESLGKDGKGTTPVKALGTVDQHSQLQLYLAGPADKAYTVLTVAAAGQGPEIPAALAEGASLGYLAGRRIGDLFAAAGRATAETLVAEKRPVRRIHLPRLDEESLGALFMHFMLETIIAADLLGVEPFDQPAVEAGKRLTRRYLEEAGS
ncbi:MAG: glucose-6-phosphate isomerase [Kiloniellales bacterium]|nr:glucose-6-phosphate isomerase [Kiloniellales bacterium]